jgi:Ca2+-binding EF-hand superfamily protein
MVDFIDGEGERRNSYTNSDLQRLNKLFYEYDEDKDGLITVRGLHELILISLDNFVLQHLDVWKLIEEKFSITDPNLGVNFIEFLTGYAKFLETVRQTQTKIDEQLNHLRVGSIREPMKRKRSKVIHNFD